jgi:hypothetical protein
MVSRANNFQGMRQFTKPRIKVREVSFAPAHVANIARMDEDVAVGNYYVPMKQMRVGNTRYQEGLWRAFLSRSGWCEMNHWIFFAPT